MSLHHVTALATNPQRNLDFYVKVLGLRFVKRTLNFDDPGTYHFYFGDAVGSPGTILTFFPIPYAQRASRGVGEVESTAFTISPNSVGYWRDRLAAHSVSVAEPVSHFGEEVIRFADPDGLRVDLVTGTASPDIQIWSDSPVPAEHTLRGFHSVTAVVSDSTPTLRLLTEVLGYQLGETSGNRQRLTVPNSAAPGTFFDVIGAPDTPRGSGGAGSVHHIAFRAADNAAQLAWREQLIGLGYAVSPVRDRTYFRSIYFREPGGILFEIATDSPGFTVDETVRDLGSSLKFPPGIERQRERIETLLPSLQLPTWPKP